LLLAVMLYVLPSYLECLCFKHSTAQEKLRSKMKFWKLFLYALFLIYPGVSSTVLRLYVCKQIYANYYLLADLNVQCYTTEWNKFAFAGMTLILLYPIGIPVFFFSLLWMNRTQLHSDRVRAQLGFLYGGYRAESWYWEVVDCVSKLFLTSILAFFPEVAQLPVGMAVAVLYIIALLWYHPYLRHTDDTLHLLAQIEIFLLLAAGNLFYYLPVQAYDSTNNIVMTIALIFVTMVFFAAFGYFAIALLIEIIYNWLEKRSKLKEKEKKKQAKLAKQQDKLDANPDHDDKQHEDDDKNEEDDGQKEDSGDEGDDKTDHKTSNNNQEDSASDSSSESGSAPGTASVGKDDDTDHDVPTNTLAASGQDVKDQNQDPASEHSSNEASSSGKSHHSDSNNNNNNNNTNGQDKESKEEVESDGEQSNDESENSDNN